MNAEILRNIAKGARAIVKKSKPGEEPEARAGRNQALTELAFLFEQEARRITALSDQEKHAMITDLARQHSTLIQPTVTERKLANAKREINRLRSRCTRLSKR